MIGWWVSFKPATDPLLDDFRKALTKIRADDGPVLAWTAAASFNQPFPVFPLSGAVGLYCAR
jgi:hypothetical protein